MNFKRVPFTFLDKEEIISFIFPLNPGRNATWKELIEEEILPKSLRLDLNFLLSADMLNSCEDTQYPVRQFEII